ncbi:hypothetical protein [Streptomyces niveus]|uniref:hypothetical protein n=1 Tax=Streptomyces niveus TaxID=193462 RepID=UPI0035DFC375
MSDFIQIKPTPAQRVPFARWAVAQTPKVRTVGTATFAVPAGLFADMPEPLLIGAIVDGHRYVEPDEDQGAELLGVANPDGMITGIPGVPLPEVPEEAYGPDSTPLPGPDPANEPTQTSDGVFLCPGCDREFTTERGRDTHRRQKHPED